MKKKKLISFNFEYKYFIVGDISDNSCKIHVFESNEKILKFYYLIY